MSGLCRTYLLNISYQGNQVFPCPSQPVTVVAALFGRATQIAKVRSFLKHMKLQKFVTFDSCLRGERCEREYNLLKWSKHSVKASNKMLEGETVSGRSRHRSNHARNRVPSVVAGHQFQEFGCIGPESRIFPTTVIVTHPGFCSKTNHFSTHLPSPNLLFRICC